MDLMRRHQPLRDPGEKAGSSGGGEGIRNKTATNYEDIADEFEAYGEGAVTDIEIGFKNVMALLGDVDGKRVLDYGCGTGKFEGVLKKHGADVVGIDIAENELAIARNNYPDVEFRTVDEMKPEFKSNFDAAVLNFVTSAVSSPEGISDIFNNIKNALKTGGKLVLLNGNYENSGGREFLTFSIGDVTKKIGSPITVLLGADRSLSVTDYFYSKDFYVERLKQAGFEIEKVIEPLAEGTEHPWRDETKFPPFLLISAIARK